MATNDGLRPEAREIFAAMEQQGRSQRDLAAALGIDADMVSKVKKGIRQFKGPELLAARRFLSLGEAGAEVRTLGMHEAPDRPLIVTTSTADGAVEIRQLDLSYSMGPGATPEDFPEETPVLFDPNFLRTITRAPTHRLYVARGDGDSMFPTLINDDQVLVDTTQNTIGQQDRIWALSYDGAHMIKRLRRAGKGRIKIISDNTTVPMDEVDEADLRIFGRVIWVGRRV
ncbi:LexA family transcriptional regulator [Sphingomonas crocodyli]|nr:S24 family peptidase [Sphingomonas crocodyli]